MSVNYLIEINGLDEWELGNPLPATAYKVMRKLLYLANKQRFPEKIKVSNSLLCSLVGCTEKSLITARQTLIQRGLIEYTGKKQHTPVYTILYFSNRSIYNCNNSSINGGINNSINDGINGGIDGSIDDRRYINKTRDTKQGNPEEDMTSTNLGADAPEGGYSNVYTPLHYPSSQQPMVGVHTRPRQGQSIDKAFPPRKGTLSKDDAYAFLALKNCLEMPHMQQMYGDNLELMQQITESDYYPLDLVFHAIEKTWERNRKYPNPLDNPAAYTIKLLDDWKQQGWTKHEQVEEAKDNWFLYG